MKIIIGSFGFTKDESFYEKLLEEKRSGKKIFIFDVRLLPDPYKLSGGKISTGGETPAVIDFLESKPYATAVNRFLSANQTIVKDVLKKLKATGEEEVEIFYGCEKGIQRSPYIAAKMLDWLKGVFFEDEIEKTDISSYAETTQIIL